MKSVFREVNLLGTQRKYGQAFSWGQFVQRYVLISGAQGFVLPMVTLLGVILITLMTTFLLGAHSTLQSSKTRQSSNASNLITDSAIARVMAELSKPENSALLVRDYDPINPANNRNYLGNDGIPNSGDEGNTNVDEWSGFAPENYQCFQEKGQMNPNLPLNGTIGVDGGTYQILAYRYTPETESGNILIQGEYQGLSSQLLISISVDSDLEDFPGVGLIRPHKNDTSKRASLGLRGRDIIGNKGNVYFDNESSPDQSVSGRSITGDINRDSHLAAIFSSTLDGVNNDSVSEQIIVCDLNIHIPFGPTGTDLGVIDNTRTLTSNGPNGITYRFDRIDLAGNETLSLDTTDGPITLVANNLGEIFQIELRNNAQIRNIRTDGQPPQVGDVRILLSSGGEFHLYDTTCVENVFFYSFIDVVVFVTTGPGCPSGRNTNFEGVIWAEAILASKNDARNRPINYLGDTNRIEDTLITPGATSGIAVPDDVSSLTDLLQYTEFPARYRFSGINSWQRVNL